jgi:hypothetical protein
MESLSPESRALYEILMAEMTEAYESHFLAHKKKILDVVQVSIADNGKKIKAVTDKINIVHADVARDLIEVKETLGAELGSVKQSLSEEITHLATSVNRVLVAPPPVSASGSGGTTVGLKGHRAALHHRGPACAHHTPPREEVLPSPLLKLARLVPLVFSQIRILTTLPLLRASNCHPSRAPILACGSVAARNTSSVGARQSVIRFPTVRPSSLVQRRLGWKPSSLSFPRPPVLNLSKQSRLVSCGISTQF